jgi:predicted nuclease with TOPRIM domain
MEASTKQMQNNLKNLEKEKQKAQIEEDDLARQYEALRKKNDQLEAKLAREQVQYFFKKSGVRLSKVRSVLFISGRPVSLTLKNIIRKSLKQSKILLKKP